MDLIPGLNLYVNNARECKKLLLLVKFIFSWKKYATIKWIAFLEKNARNQKTVHNEQYKTSLLLSFGNARNIMSPYKEITMGN